MSNRSLPDTPMVKIMRNTSNKYLSSSPGGAGCLLAGARHLPLISQDNMPMKQPSVGKRKCLALFGTIGCREQPISAHGRLERVLKRAKRFRLMAQLFLRTRYTPVNPNRHVHGIQDVQCLQRCWNSQLCNSDWVFLAMHQPVGIPVME